MCQRMYSLVISKGIPPVSAGYSPRALMLCYPSRKRQHGEIDGQHGAITGIGGWTS